MIGINLIPPDVRRRRAIRRRMRTWICLATPVAILVLLPFVAEGYRLGRVENQQRELTKLEGRLRTLRQEVVASAAAVRAMETDIARARALRTKRSWAGLLALLAEAMPEEVWLTSLSTDRGADTKTPRRVDPAATAVGNQNGAPTPAVVLEAAVRLELTGFALNHERLYDLMSRLKEDGAFSSVELVKAGMEPALEGRAVRFVLACGW